MTLEMLNHYRMLQKDIQLDLERLKLLEAQAYAVGAASISAMPTSNEPHSRTERYAIKLVELREKLQEDIYRKVETEIEIRTFMEAQDAQMRLVLKLRFERGYSWGRVGLETNLTEDAAKKAVYRLIQKGGERKCTNRREKTQT